MAEEKGKLVIRLESSELSPAGAAAAFLLRRIAARAGSYAPGIQEHLFYEMGQRSNGVSLAQVESWIRKHSAALSNLGYYVLVRQLAAPTTGIKRWVTEGEGYRAAILATDGAKLHQDTSLTTTHAVGLTVNDATSGIADDNLGNGLLMIDAWPGKARFTSPPATLDVAHRSQQYRSLLMYWSGHG